MNKKVIPAITLGAVLFVVPMYCKYLDRNKSQYCQQLESYVKPSGEEKIAPFSRYPSEIDIMQIGVATTGVTAGTSSVYPGTITPNFILDIHSEA